MPHVFISFRMFEEEGDAAARITTEAATKSQWIATPKYWHP